MSDPGQRRIPHAAPCVGEEEIVLVSECLRSGWVSSAGPWVSRFESELAAKVGAADAVSTSSGTAALHLALLCSDVGPGDSVLVPTLTFIAPVNAVRYAGAEPIFLDCDEHLNVDPMKLEAFLGQECVGRGDSVIHRATGTRVRAILPVHVFGGLANLDAILPLARANGLAVIEDATEALGSAWLAGGASAGTRGDIGCFSFNGNKIITTGGGGMMVARDPGALKRARYLSTQAKDDELFFRHECVGYNYRLTSLQAALGIAQLAKLDRFVERKRRIHALYSEELADWKGGSVVGEPPGTRSNHWLSAAIFHGRPDLRSAIAKLETLGIQSRPVWGLCHAQRPYKDSPAYRIEKATDLAPRILTLPSSVDSSDEEIRRVARAVKSLGA